MRNPETNWKAPAPERTQNWTHWSQQGGSGHPESLHPAEHHTNRKSVPEERKRLVYTSSTPPFLRGLLRTLAFILPVLELWQLCHLAAWGKTDTAARAGRCRRPSPCPVQSEWMENPCQLSAAPREEKSLFLWPPPQFLQGRPKSQQQSNPFWISWLVGTVWLPGGEERWWFELMRTIAPLTPDTPAKSRRQKWQPPASPWGGKDLMEVPTISNWAEWLGSSVQSQSMKQERRLLCLMHE